MSVCCSPRFMRPFLAAATFATVVGVALVAQSNDPAAAKMTVAANKFLATLSPELKAQTAFPYDAANREEWFFTPAQKDKQPLRKGVRFEHLSAAQKTAALDLLRAGLSGKGYEQATTIMSLEGLLAELEGTTGAMVRNPNWYFVSIFGEPSNTGRWGWRIEGHHLSVNYTIDKGEVLTATPVVFASNPAEVKSGAKKGLRPLPDSVDLAQKLVGLLDDEQKKLARKPKAFPEIKENKPTAGVGEPVGLPRAKMTEPQQAALWALVESYANRLPVEVAAAELKRITAGGRDAVHFAYSLDEAKPGKPFTYRVQGPTFVIEFLNEQADAAKNPANHIHSGWRRLPTDFPPVGAK